MTDIIEVAKKYNISLARVDDSFHDAAREDIEAFTDHYRKEGAEEANKTIEHLKAVVSAESKRVQRAEQQLAATELVMEQLQEALVVAQKFCNSFPADECPDFVAIPINDAVKLTREKCTDERMCSGCFAGTGCELQPSLSALREHEAKVLEDAASKFKYEWNGDSDTYVEQQVDNETYEVLMEMASELRAKGDK